MKLHPSIQHLAMPARMRKLPLTEMGFPTLWFAEIVNGKPDLRVMSGQKMVRAIKEKRCWLCGEPLGIYKAFVIGPMCTISRTTQEPPSHYDCALYAVKACPFLTRPNRERNERGIENEEKVMIGYGLKRNPGVTAIWVSRSYKTWRPPMGGVLMTVGEPWKVEWWAEGRPATRQEVMASIESGSPVLWKLADEDPRPGAHEALQAQIKAAEQYLPAA